MKQIGHIKDDIYPLSSTPHQIRKTVRGVIIHEDKVALLQIEGDDIFGHRFHYELPGGGIEENESPLLAFQREVKEELGVEVDKIEEIGEVSITYNLLARVDEAICYKGEVSSWGETSFTEIEQRFVKQIVWVPLRSILKFYNDLDVQNVGKLIHKRDLKIILAYLNPLLRQAKLEELTTIKSILNDSKEFIKSYNSPQWQDVNFDSLPLDDVYVVTFNKEIIATLTILTDEPDYQGLEWIGKKYLVVHRLAISNQYRGCHITPLIFQLLLEFALEYDSIRIDTHHLNQPMINFLSKFGFTYKGEITLRSNGQSRLAYEYLISPFRTHLGSFLPLELVNQLINAIDLEPIKAFRYNTLLVDNIELDNTELHPFIPYARISKESLGKTPQHFCGAIYIQDSSAMLVAHLLNPQPGELVIDLCAAPGGKATQALILMEDQGLLVANDISYKRAKIINENLERLGLKNAIVTNNQVSELLKHFGGSFDKVILDAPCSGEGMFRKNQAMEDDWSISKVERCATLQKELILQAYALLKYDGVMVYSTCTFEKIENEDVINHLLQNTNAELIRIPSISGAQRGIGIEEAIRLYPHLFPGEGHFICLIRCKDEHQEKIKKSKTKLENSQMKLVEQTLRELTNYKLTHSPITHNNLVLYLPYGNIDFGQLNVLRYGLPLGHLETKRFEPTHALLRAIPFKQNYILESYQDYLKFLKGEVLPCSKEYSGYLCVTYLNLRVGLGKASNGQIKNLLPKQLRI